MTETKDAAQAVLSETFGYREFRSGQLEIVELLTQGTNVLVVMPTGAGKSLCYQVPALLSENLTIVVSPLVALMDDQVAALRSNGIAAACVHSGLPRDEQVANWRKIASGESKILYLSPERLMTGRMLAAIDKLTPGLFVVDEAHCISKWGVSFRPEYDQLSVLCERFPSATIAGFTATADEATRKDISAKLFRDDGRTIVHGFNRPNLRLNVAPKRDWKSQLDSFLSTHEGEAGIVYCLSRKLTEQVAQHISGGGRPAIAYHAGQDPDLRRRSQNRFMSEDGLIMVATIAFGMGIDKPDIRFVCHLNLPGSMEAYYQEIGRAGRDGEAADTLMIYGFDDIRLRRQFIEDDGEDDGHRLREHKRLDALLAYCEAPGCRRVAMLGYFGEAAEPCGNCDNCLDPPLLIDGTPEAQTVVQAIEQTGGYFGRSHIIDLIRGSENRKILERGHDQLPVYGGGAHRVRAFWQGFLNQMIAGGHLTINLQQYGALQITPLGQNLTEGDVQFTYREITITEKGAGARRVRSTKSAPSISDPADQELLGRLKTLRRDLAQARNVPAYVVFPDATLMELASIRPATIDAMAEINGIGPVKLKTYGETFLAAIREPGPPV